MAAPKPKVDIPFTSYQKFVLAILAFLQFTIILDFMILSPLGAILLPALNITPSQFGLVVSAYAFSAGASGLLAAGFADRFDRKKLLLFFYVGFVVGTLLCGIAPNFEFLLGARIVTGLFGGVIGSIVFAITTDLFAFEVRGKVMGILQTAFAASQILGVPLGLFLANKWGWHSPFLLIVGVSAAAGVLGVTLDQLPYVYIATGISSIVMGPIIGRLSDRIGKFPMFLVGCAIAIISVIVYTRMPIIGLYAVMIVSMIMFVGISARMISSSALMSALPDAADRGSYMSVSSSVQQISGGIAAALAGLIIVQNPDGSLGRMDILGDVIVGSTVVTAIMMTFIYRFLKKRDEGLKQKEEPLEAPQIVDA
ncbi:MAG: MFS transporter [Proteobacteria bacterium]|nr:MAG: MFS transporter [Pseudomonadota bacterium]